MTYELSQNYPNPFNPSTKIEFQIPEDGFVSIKIYNTIGEEIASLVNGFITTGKYRLILMPVIYQVDCIFIG